MRDQLKTSVRPPLNVTGPFKLGKGIPDLDLLLEDPVSDALVLAELKWPRKPYAPREILQRDSEIRKGIAQIKAIKAFLTANPRFLADRGKLAKQLTEYKHVQCCVVSRDHLIASHETDLPVFGYDAFEHYMSGTKTAPEAITALNKMDWLPREGEDFRCEWTRNAVGGVTTLTELFLLKTAGQPVVSHQ